MTESTTLLTQHAYAAHRHQQGLPGGTQPAVHRALKAGRISFAPGTSLIDPEQADRDWRKHTEPRPQFPANARAESAPSAAHRFRVRQAEAVAIPNVRQALRDAYDAITSEYKALSSQLAARTEPMLVADLGRLIDETFDRLDAALAACVELAYTARQH